MKLLSGTASVTLNKCARATLAITMAALGFSATAFAQSANDLPRTRTEPALACLLGSGPQGCQATFGSPAAAWRSTTYCTAKYVHRWQDNCWNGPLVTVKYLGADVYRADVYDVKYMNADTTYVIPPAGPDGRIPRFWIYNSPPGAVIGEINHKLVTVISTADHTPLLYGRPEQARPAGSS
jgi:hypothetical protein